MSAISTAPPLQNCLACVGRVRPGESQQSETLDHGWGGHPGGDNRPQSPARDGGKGRGDQGFSSRSPGRGGGAGPASVSQKRLLVVTPPSTTDKISSSKRGRWGRSGLRAGKKAAGWLPAAGWAGTPPPGRGEGWPSEKPWKGPTPNMPCGKGDRDRGGRKCRALVLFYNFGRTGPPENFRGDNFGRTVPPDYPPPTLKPPPGGG